MPKQSSKNETRYPKNEIVASRARPALDDVAVFVLVAKHASFVTAARSASIPTSTVSRAVARLEENMGVRLLARTTRRVALTDEGRQLALAAAPHLDGLQEALVVTSDRRSEPSGLIRVTAPAYTGATRVATALAELSEKYPELAIEIDSTNALRDLVEGGFDFGVRVGPIADQDFVARRLWSGNFGLFAAKSFVKSSLRGKKHVMREVVERSPCITLRANQVWRFRDSSGRVVAMTPRVRFAVNDPRAAVEVARHGGGLVVAPREAVAALERSERGSGLVALTTELGDPEPVELFIVYPSRRLLPRRVQLAIDWLRRPKYRHRFNGLWP